MIQQILHKTADTLQEIFLAGSAVAHQHSGLLSHIAALEPLASKVPAFARLRQELTDLSNSTAEHAPTHLLQVQSLVSAILYTQTQTSRSDAVENFSELPPIDFQKHSLSVGLRALEATMAIEAAGHPSKMIVLARALNEHGLFKDWRTFPAFKRLLAKEWHSRDDIKLIDEEIPELAGESFTHYFYHSAVEKENIANHIHYLIRKNIPYALEWGKQVIADASLSKMKINLAAAVESLGFSGEHEVLALEYTHHKILEVRIAAYRALIRMQSPQIRSLLLSQLCTVNNIEELEMLGSLFDEIKGKLSEFEQETLLAKILSEWQTIIPGKKLEKKQFEHNYLTLKKMHCCFERLIGTESIELLPILKTILEDYVPEEEHYASHWPFTTLLWLFSREGLAQQHLPALIACFDMRTFIRHLLSVLHPGWYPSVISLDANQIYDVLAPHIQCIDWAQREEREDFIYFLVDLANQERSAPWLPYISQLIETGYQSNRKFSVQILEELLSQVDEDSLYYLKIVAIYLKGFTQCANFALDRIYTFDLFKFFITEAQESQDFQQLQQVFIDLLPKIFQAILMQLEPPKEDTTKNWDVVEAQLKMRKQLNMLQVSLEEFLIDTEGGRVSISTTLHAHLVPAIQDFVDKLNQFEQQLYDQYKGKKSVSSTQYIRQIIHAVYGNPKLAVSPDDYIQQCLKGFMKFLDVLQNATTSVEVDGSVWSRLESDCEWLTRAFGNIEKLSVPVSQTFIPNLTELNSRFEKILKDYESFDADIRQKLWGLLKTVRQLQVDSLPSLKSGASSNDKKEESK